MEHIYELHMHSVVMYILSCVPWSSTCKWSHGRISRLSALPFWGCCSEQLFPCLGFWLGYPCLLLTHWIPVISSRIPQRLGKMLSLASVAQVVLPWIPPRSIATSGYIGNCVGQWHLCNKYPSLFSSQKKKGYLDSPFSLFSTCIPGIELRPSGLAESASTH